MAASGYVRTAVSPLQETMRVALSLSDNQMALLQGPVIGIPVALVSIPLGILIDRYSRARLLVVLLVLSLIGSALTAWAPSFDGLLWARGVAGLTALGAIPVIYSLIADFFPPSQRGRVTTVISVGQVAGNSAAFALGGALLTMAGAETDGGWRWAMVWLILPLVPVIFLMLAVREPVRSGVVIAHPTARQVWGEIKQYRMVIGPLALGIILVETAVGAMLIWAAPMLSRRFGLPPDRIGSVMAIGMLVGGILGPVLGGVLADLCHSSGGPRRTILALTLLALLSIPVAMFAFAPGIALTSMLLIACMTIMLAIAVMGTTLFTIVIPNELRGLCMSVLVAANILCSYAVAPVVVSLLSGAMGGLPMIGKSLSVVCVTAGTLAAATFVFARRYFR
jgi:MFS family permease